MYLFYKVYTPSNCAPPPHTKWNAVPLIIITLFHEGSDEMLIQPKPHDHTGHFKLFLLHHGIFTSGNIHSPSLNRSPFSWQCSTNCRVSCVSWLLLTSPSFNAVPYTAPVWIGAPSVDSAPLTVVLVVSAGYYLPVPVSMQSPQVTVRIVTFLTSLLLSIVTQSFQLGVPEENILHVSEHAQATSLLVSLTSQPPKFCSPTKTLT
jgi:hypothetical protein